MYTILRLQGPVANPSAQVKNSQYRLSLSPQLFSKLSLIPTIKISQLSILPSQVSLTSSINVNKTKLEQ